ncbi:MAG: Uncharacterized protein XD42_0565 [Thermodesulfobacterium sp. 37_54]|jgi:hypothetical protein|uniref:Uncharacterized protein n=2 Tax=Thermodesulfobacterium commune TaxID=1741 RepID=A0A075X168_9BACT|nr:hypothetical protein [Thermodesulfobacterium commune]KUJ97781.1 MAG: Uncharacterized protein XD42_0565 [Thermodesulfobacterium sp. 37_54]MDK2861771.1 hypothetical protein [Thermodesulfobacterium sp.]AIH04752.1 hypothetical protein HL41_08910 [Thermodesulfobacterium commune DSM 2178]KUK19343.1 MAG: Uncharacterized protein XD55_0591 [Thermodesulfobacterium commune]KUK38072.1 MAG: Uncharacterized protein XD67_0648 [Thermodesulfobacterium commune]
MEYILEVFLDDYRLAKLKGTPVEANIESVFGGELKVLRVKVGEEVKNEILKAFETARIDSRACITDTPVAFKRALFEEIVNQKSLGEEVVKAVLANIGKIKELAAKEAEYLPAPEIEIE